MISPELDGQITDLLSAIRKSEEEEAASKENVEATEINDGEEKTHAENNSDEVNMEQGEGEVINDEENTGYEENIDENMTEENEGEEVSENIDTQNSEAAEETETQDEKVDNETETLKEANEGETQISNQKTPTKTEEQSDDRVGDLKSNANGRATPSRMSARIANVTPSTIRTRRASRLANQN